MSLVRVWTDVGARKPVPLLARIIEKDGVILTIKYLSEGSDHVWRYEDDTYDIDDDSVAEYLKTDIEEDLGFRTVEDGFVKIDSDEDYVPSSEESSDDEDEDEDEEESDEFTETDEEDASDSEESLGEE
jgi:ribonuclease E